MEYSEHSLYDIIKIIRLVMQKEINGREIKARQKREGKARNVRFLVKAFWRHE